MTAARSWGDIVTAALERFGQWAMCKLHLCHECERCQTYVCWCGRRRPWSDGCADDMPEACDDCWSLAHRRWRR
jgi:hypothetical protein